MSYSIAQTNTGDGIGASSFTITQGNTTTGNLMVVVVGVSLTTVSSVTDSQSNKYVLATSSNASNVDVEIWYAKNIVGGTTPTITVTLTTSDNANGIAREYSGIDASVALDKAVAANGIGGTPSSGNTGTTTQASELVVGGGAFGTTAPTVGSGFSNFASKTTVAAAITVIEDKEVLATGTQSAAFTGGGAIWSVGAATFKEINGYDNSGGTTNLGAQTTGGTTTFSFTVGSGSNRLLIVSISTWNNGGTGAGCSGVTYNGTSMTAVGNGVANGQFYTEQWRLVAPASGTANIVATVSGKTDKLGLGAVSFSGMDQTTGIDVSTSATGTSGTVTASLTTTAISEYIVDAVSHLSANNPTSFTGAKIYSDAANGVSTDAQYQLSGATGTNSASWTFPDPGDGWAYSTLAVKAFSGVSDLNVSVSDSTTTSENTKTEVNSFINKSDATTTSENIVLTDVGNINISDSDTLTESIKLLSQENIVVSNSTTTSESISLALTPLLISVSDSTITSENTQLLVTSFISVSDSTTLSENVQIAQFNTISVSDLTATSENIQLLLQSNIIVSDSTTTSENVVVLIPQLVISVSDNTATSENVQLVDVLLISTSDSTTTAENVSLLLISSINVSDSTTLSENVQLLESVSISISDIISISENIRVTEVSLVSVSDTTITGENINLLITSNTLVSDNTTLSENLQLFESVVIGVSDSTTTSENILVQFSGINNIVVSDSTVTSENVNLLLLVTISISDNAIMSESISLSINQTINKSDSTTTSENVQLTIANIIVVSDFTTLSENILFFQSLVNIIVQDIASLSESSLVFLPQSFIDVESFVLIVEPILLTLVIPATMNMTAKIG